MINHHRSDSGSRPQHTRLPLRITAISLFFVLVPLLLTGCGMIGKMGRQTVQVAKEITGGGWIRKVGVVPLENRTLLPDGSVDRLFQTPFMDRLAGACPGADYVTPKDSGSENNGPAGLGNIPQDASGDISRDALLSLARSQGIQQVLQVRADHIEVEERETGFLIFRDTEYIGRIRVSLILWDTLNGVKLLSEIMSREKEIDGMEYDAVNARDHRHLMVIPEMLASLAEEAADRVCAAVHDRTWEAEVVKADGSEGEVSAGTDSGIREGDRVRLYGPGEEISGRKGQIYRLPGEEIGRGLIFSTEKDRSQLRLEGEGTLLPGTRARP